MAAATPPPGRPSAARVKAFQVMGFRGRPSKHTVKSQLLDQFTKVWLSEIIFHQNKIWS